MEQPSKIIEVFSSYSHRDELLRDEADKHLSVLRRRGIIRSWYDRNIDAGAEFAHEIDEHLNSAHLIILYISADFIASDYCYSVEMTRAMERHERGEAQVIPVILRACDWKHAPFGKLKALPKDGKAVTSWLNIDEALTDVAIEVRKAIEGRIQHYLSAL